MVKDSNKQCGQGTDQTDRCMCTTSIIDNTFGGQCRDHFSQGKTFTWTNDLSDLVTFGWSAEKTKAHLSIHAIVLDEMKTKFPLIFTIANVQTI